MADFLTDYSNLAGAGSAFQGFAQGFQNAQDQKMKRQEMQAKMDAMKADQDRAATESALKMRMSGFQQGPGGPTDLQPAPVTLKQKSDNNLKAFGEGAKPIIGQDGQPTGDYEVNKETPRYKSSVLAGQKFQAGNDFKQEGLDLRKDVVDRREHEKVLSRITANPNIKTRLQQYQNLDNTLSNIANADHITPEMFDEAQQAIRANLGIKGSSGVDERGLTQMKSIGLNADRFSQFLTGMPSDVGAQNEFLKHIKNLAELEKKNISTQFDKSLNAGSAGHASMYGRRPDLKDDLKDFLSAQKDQLESPQQAAPPQGLVQPQQGFLSRAAGMLGFGQPAQAAAPVPAQHPQDSVALQWAKANPKDPRSAAIFQMNGAK